MRKTTLVLNLDGVCLDPSRALETSLRRALIRIGRPISPQRKIPSIASQPIEQTIAELLGEGNECLLDATLRALLQEYQRRGQYTASPWGGIHNALQRVHRDAGVDCWLLSNRPYRAARELVARAQLTHSSNGLIAPEQSLPPSRLLAILLSWLEQRRVQHPVVYVTDCPREAEQARAAQITVMLAAWGRSGWRCLRTAGARWVIAEPSHLPAMLRLAQTSFAPASVPSIGVFPASVTLPILTT